MYLFQIIEIDHDYTGCDGIAIVNGTQIGKKQNCAQILLDNPGISTCECTIPIIVSEAIPVRCI